MGQLARMEKTPRWRMTHRKNQQPQELLDKNKVNVSLAIQWTYISNQKGHCAPFFCLEFLLGNLNRQLLRGRLYSDQ